MGIVSELRATSGQRHILMARVLAGLPLLGLGVVHLIEPEAFRVLLRLGGFPASFNAVGAPVAEVLAGLLLLGGLFARIGGALGIATMLPAIYTTWVIERMEFVTMAARGVLERPEMPPLVLPVLVFLASAYVIWSGAGAWSLDARATAPVRGAG